WDCTLEPTDKAQPAIRMGFRMIRGLHQDCARRLEDARQLQAIRHVEDLCLRARLDSRSRELLADASALQGLAGHRHQARWAVAGVEPQLPLFAGSSMSHETPAALPRPSVGEDLLTDYATLGTTLGPHPLQLLRTQLRTQRCRSSRELAEVEPGRLISIPAWSSGGNAHRQPVASPS